MCVSICIMSSCDDLKHISQNKFCNFALRTKSARSAEAARWCKFGVKKLQPPPKKGDAIFMQSLPPGF